MITNVLILLSIGLFIRNVYLGQKNRELLDLTNDLKKDLKDTRQTLKECKASLDIYKKKARKWVLNYRELQNKMPVQ